jgi:hypothetical protein
MAIDTRHIGVSDSRVLRLAPRVGARALDRIQVGRIERSDPIPPGVYWIDSIDPSAFENPGAVEAARDAYELAIEANYMSAFRIVRTVHHDSQIIGDTQPARDWILFQITAPVPRWSPDTKWGLPTVAPNGLETQEGDTVQRPPPEQGILDEWLPDTPLGKALLIGGAIGLATLIVIAIKS